MGALEAASQWHVQGLGLKVSSFPSPGSSPSATRTTVNMLLTVLAITREVTLDTSVSLRPAGRECPWPRPGGTSEPLWRWWCSGGGRSTGTRLSQHPMHVSGTLLGQGWKWGTAWGLGGGALPENHHLLCFSWASGNKELHRKTNVPDVSCPHITSNSVSFPHFHSCNLPFFSP